MPPKNKVLQFESKIKEIKEITPTVKHFVFETPEDFVFDAGQFISIRMDHPDADHEYVKRAYSIASSPHIKGEIHLCIKLVEDGIGTPFLWKENKLDTLPLMGPMGRFGIPEEDLGNEMCFISTGTGFAPFRCMITWLLEEKKAQQKLYQFCGYRYEDEELYLDEIAERQKNFANYQYHCAISRPRSEDFDGVKGHVQVVIKEHLPKDFKGDFYLCGLTPMINETKKLLMEEYGVSEERIRFEKFD